MKKAFLTYTFLLLAICMFGHVPVKEKQILLDFYTATNGSQWNSQWNLDEPVENWKGLTVENNTVTGISLLFNNVSGVLPASLGELKNLKVLELSFNPITGNIPSEIGNLKNLEVLALNGTALEGTIPSTLGDLSNLKQLHLSSNKLSGEVPESLGNLKNIEVFNIFDNNLTGKLPIGLTHCDHLRELMVAENNFNNADNFSVVLLSNSGASINLDNKSPQPELNNSIIAVERDDSQD